MIYRRRATALHAARAGAGAAYLVALGVVTLLTDNPIVLGSVTLTLAAAGILADNGRAVRRTLMLAVPVAAVIVVINALVSRDGLTVIARLGDLPLIGHTDITLEATVYGGILALRATALLLCGALYTAAVDPDEMLDVFRRISFRSALTATLATRLVPVLLRDSRRLAEAQRCRPGPPPSRLQLMRAASAGVLDRALDVAAALEIRGYGAVRSAPAGRGRRALSRHDIAFGAAAGGLLALAAAMRLGRLAPAVAYPALHVGAGPTTLAVALAVPVLALLPFADRRGVMP